VPPRRPVYFWQQTTDRELCVKEPVTDDVQQPRKCR
jgi:hypothetical protein